HHCAGANLDIGADVEHPFAFVDDDPCIDLRRGEARFRQSCHKAVWILPIAWWNSDFNRHLIDSLRNPVSSTSAEIALVVDQLLQISRRLKRGMILVDHDDDL